jgi:cell division cycle 2-like
MHQFLGAMCHIHDNWYIHRDLKTSNLLYSNKGILSVCDFGMARKYGSPLIPYTQCVVTLWYRAPELLLAWGVEHAAQHCVYSTPLDMWSVGCIFAEMITRKPLFPGQGELDQINLIFKLLGAPNEEKWPGFSSLPHATKVSWKAPSNSKLREVGAL